jgi:hypothetical protein
VAEQIVFTSLEKLVILNVQDNVQISRRTVLRSCVAFSRYSQLGTIVDTCRNLQLERFFADDAAIAAARMTPILDDLTRAMTLTTSASDAEESLLETDLAISITRLTGRWT